MPDPFAIASMLWALVGAFLLYVVGLFQAEFEWQIELIRQAFYLIMIFAFALTIGPGLIDVLGGLAGIIL